MELRFVSEDNFVISWASVLCSETFDGEVRQVAPPSRAYRAVSGYTTTRGSWTGHKRTTASTSMPRRHSETQGDDAD